MGWVMLEFFEDNFIYVCCKCNTHITKRKFLISKNFQAKQGKGFLFSMALFKKKKHQIWKWVNLTYDHWQTQNFSDLLQIVFVRIGLEIHICEKFFLKIQTREFIVRKSVAKKTVLGFHLNNYLYGEFILSVSDSNYRIIWYFNNSFLLRFDDQNFFSNNLKIFFIFSKNSFSLFVKSF